MFSTKNIIIIITCFILLHKESFATPSVMETYFPDIEGFSKSGDIAFYNPENLYDKIDGAADMYLNYGFEELAVLTYKKPENQSISVEIYRHKDADYGFGIYSMERYSGTTNFVDIGTEGYYESGILNFYKNCYYVKISAYHLDDEENVLNQIARKIANALPGENKLPEIFENFPERNRMANYEHFDPANFMGYDFLRNAYSTYYSIPGSSDYFTFFIIRGDSKEDCREMLTSYFDYIHHEAVKVKGGLYIVEDPYYGKVGMYWKGNFIRGTFGLEDTGLMKQYLENKFEKPEVVKVKGNIAFRKPATSSSVENQNHLAVFATDGIDKTRWSSSFSDPQWICVDLKKEYPVNKVVLMWEGAYGKEYQIQTSVDGENWNTVYNTDSSDGERDEIGFENVHARYVRMYGQKRATSWGYSLYEFQVFKSK
jgi:hypothetical protein